MADRLRELPKKILDWWNKFNARQKTIIISIAAGVVLTFVILFTILTRPQYVLLITCETTQEAAEVVDVLEGGGINDYRTDSSSLQISVRQEDEAAANRLLGAQGIPTDTFGIDNVVSGGFSSTEADKQKLYKVYMESHMKSHLEDSSLIKTANVQLDLPTDDGTLISQKEEASVAISLELEGELTPDAAAGFARYAATAMGNDTTDNVTIIDWEGNLLFTGDDSMSISGTSNSQLAAQEQVETLVKGEVRSVLLGTDLYDNVEVSSNLSLDFSTLEKTWHEYSAPEGRTEGMLSEEETYNASSSGFTGGEPGTGSNDQDGTTYVMPDSNSSSSDESSVIRRYLPNEYMERQIIPAGLIKYDESSVAVTAKNIKVYREEQVDDQGLLVDMSWEEFKAANEAPVKLEVDPEFYSIVSKATGIAEENIQITAYDSPLFIDKEGFSIQPDNVIQIVLFLAILGLFAFVVLRSMRSEKTEEPEPELSVESLLQSTPEIELEDIEFDEKSEARKMIEKFVEDNPEAVASLLRNWLMEEWG